MPSRGQPAPPPRPSLLARLARRVDPYLAALLGCVVLGSLLPARGVAARALDLATDVVIVVLFFLYGTRLSPRDAWNGARNLKLQGLVLASTYLLFPALALLVDGLTPALPRELRVGLVFLGVLPSTVQSSIAFTSIARGNVAAALTAATFSNVLGVFLTPLLLAALLRQDGVALGFDSMQKLVLQLLAPFFLGQLLRRRVEGFVARHKQAFAYVDRGSILLVVYAAFSEGVQAGIWQRVSAATLGWLMLACGLLLGLVLWTTTRLCRWLGLSKADEITGVFCGSKKSLASGLPMASVLFPEASVGLVALPLMLFHQLQLMACAWLARRYAQR
jgi:sodium/bile acid cotransporter 7